MANAADLPLYQMKCYDQANYLSFRGLVELLCPPGFAVSLATSSRIKSIFNGRCVWQIYYISNGTNVNGSVAFKDAVKTLTANLPIGSKVVGFGRCFDPNTGIVIHLGHLRCQCLPDFEIALTPLHIFMELRDFIFWYCEKFNSAETCAAAVWSLIKQFGHRSGSLKMLVFTAPDDEDCQTFDAKPNYTVLELPLIMDTTLEVCQRAVEAVKIDDSEIQYRLAYLQITDPENSPHLELLDVNFNI